MLKSIHFAKVVQYIRKGKSSFHYMNSLKNTVGREKIYQMMDLIRYNTYTAIS